MRSKNPAVMEKIRSFVDMHYREHHTVPSVRTVAEATGVARATVQRYLTAMEESSVIRKCATGYFSAPIVGSIRCGDPESEQEQVEEYVSLPESIFGKGKFYLVRARGDSMIDAGIDEGDLVLIELCHEANEGDIVVALDPEGENTLKRYAGKDKDDYVLAYMNEAQYPGKALRVKSFIVQGVARHVIKTL